MLGQEGAFFGVAGNLHTVGQGLCRDYLDTILMVPVRGGSPLPSWGYAGTLWGRALVREMIGVPMRGVAGPAPAAGMVLSCPWSALSLR